MKRDLSLAVAAVAIIAAVTFGLARMRPDLPLTPSSPHTGASKAGAPVAAKQGKVIMRVNGEAVTEAEFNAFMGAVPEQQRAMFSTPAGRRELANELVRMKALEQEARRMGIADDPEVVMQIDLLRTQVTATRALQKIVEAKAEAQIRAAYDREKSGAQSLRHIVVAYEGGQIPPRQQGQEAPSESEAMKRAQSLVARIRSGADFGQVARTESDDTRSAAAGGSLGPIPMENLPPEIGSVVKTLKPGQVSDPVRTPLGLHIFSVGVPTLEELRPALEQRVQNELVQREVMRLQSAAKVELDPQFFPPVTPQG